MTNAAQPIIPSGAHPAELHPLSDDEVTASRQASGRNEIPTPPRPGLARLVAGQVKAPLVVVLIIAGMATALLGRWLEGSVIGAIVIINSYVGAIQERRADFAMEALGSLTAPRATVRRSTGVLEIPAAEVVPGDLLELHAGDRIAADGRLLSASSLAVDESLLTGESLAVDKHLRPDLPGRGVEDGSVPSDEVLAGTFVVRGSGTAVVIRVGTATSMGRIADALVDATPAPLEVELKSLAKWMGVLAGALGLGLGVAVYVRPSHPENRLADAAISAIALAVAAIPEGLVAIVTTALALGAQRMARKGAIVRRLAAIEALGSATVICTDKTGTLTTGQLVVADTVPLGSEADLALAAMRCNDSIEDVGDPVDVALTRYATSVTGSLPTGTRLAVAPFDALTRSMATVHDTADGPVLTVKGAPEVVFERCKPSPVTDELRSAVERITQSGQRVLAFATAAIDDLDADSLTPVGVISFIDPLRDTAHETLAACRRASVRVVMVTGDHAATARSIARSAGFPAVASVTPADLAGLPSNDRDSALRAADVVARVDPATKVELVEAHRRNGAIVAMTGDGVNDAPALRAAEIGVAMSGGSDIAREAASVVITDGDLGRLVDAIAEGRTIHRNLRSVVAYLVSGNLAEILLVAASLVVFAEIGAPFAPVQLLWVNLITDGLPALALGADRASSDPLAAPPRPRAESLVSKSFLGSVVAWGVAVATIVAASGVVARALGARDGEIRAQLLLSLLVAHLSLPLVARSEHHSFEGGWLRSRGVIGTVAASLVIQIPAFTWSPLRHALALDPARTEAWPIAFACGLSTLAVIDLGRAIRRRTANVDSR